MNIYQFLRALGSISSIAMLFILSFVEQAFATSEPLTKADVAQLAKESCAAELPNLDEHYKTASRKKVNWDSKKIGIVNGYKFHLEKGVLKLEPGVFLSWNTPINSERYVLSLTYFFPSLRGPDDSSYIKDRERFFKEHPHDWARATQVPESLISVSVNQVPNWKELPVTQETKFSQLFFKPNLSAEQISRAKRNNEAFLSQLRPDDKNLEIKKVTNFEQYGLKEIISSRLGMFYYEPIDNKNISPYGLPRFNCDSVGRLGVTECVGHFRMDDDYLVTYQLPFKLMQCWQKVEDGVRRVIRLNTQSAN